MRQDDFVFFKETHFHSFLLLLSIRINLKVSGKKWLSWFNSDYPHYLLWLCVGSVQKVKLRSITEKFISSNCIHISNFPHRLQECSLLCFNTFPLCSSSSTFQKLIFSCKIACCAACINFGWDLVTFYTQCQCHLTLRPQSFKAQEDGRSKSTASNYTERLPVSDNPLKVSHSKPGILAFQKTGRA